MYVGIRAFGHDSSIFHIDIEKKEIFALESEKVTRIKHDQISFFPAFKKLMEQKKDKFIKISHPMIEFKRGKIFKDERDLRWNLYRKAFNIKFLKDQILANQNKKFILDKNAYMEYILLKNSVGYMNIPQYVSKIIKRNYFVDVRNRFYDHHLSHNISAFAFSKFKKAITISIDGFGDGFSLKAYIMKKKEETIDYTLLGYSKVVSLKTIKTNAFENLVLCNSIGSLFNYFTNVLGFIPNSDEGKVEALATFGKVDEKLLNEILSLFEIKLEEGFLVLNMKNFLNLNIKSIKRENLAATLQESVKIIIINYLKELFKIYECENIVFSGGVFSNVSLNLAIYEKFLKNSYIFPAMGDGGSPAGAVILDMLNDGIKWKDLEWIENEIMPYWGIEYNDEEILQALNYYNNLVDWEYIDNFEEEITNKILQNKIVAIFQGRNEFGPRALGNRSILANAFTKESVYKINSLIKKREKFQPFCPSLLEEDKFILEKNYINYHMTTAFRVKKEFLDKIPAAVHIDNTARVQFVNEYTNRSFYKILKYIKKEKGIGIVINTSFNLHGRAMVLSPKDAIVDFISSGIDYLYFKNIKVRKRF